MSQAMKTITPVQLRDQVNAYGGLLPEYALYAAALKRVFERACKTAFPEAMVQARPKSIASFAEKCVRKFDRYPDAANQMTDLCGARVIVQTLTQVKAVRRYIEANFTIDEADEKGLSLGEDKFGYRDMHYIVRLPAMPEAREYHCDTRKAEALGFEPREIEKIGDKQAEIQVRTWVQHAWADTLHDRIYKAKLKYPAEFKRSGALLAAIMEDGDRAFDRLSLDIDGMLANYSSYTSKAEVEREIDMQTLILTHVPESKKPALASQLARLVSACGDYPRVVRELAPFADVQGPLRCELLLDLGFALCKVHRHEPKSVEYRRGQRYLEESICLCTDDALEAVPNLRRRRSLHARGLARLAWSWEVVPGETHRARDAYRQAQAIEPQNPYYLTDVLGYEAHVTGSTEFVASMTSTLVDAIRVCECHAISGTELPYACFAAGRLQLLLNEPLAALGCYARGVRHVLAATNCAPAEVMDLEVDWLLRVSGAHRLAGGYLWARQLLELAKCVMGFGDDTLDEAENEPTALPPPALILAGGAASLSVAVATRLEPMLAEALAGFQGTLLSGGTAVGIPGCAGHVAASLAARDAKRFDLVGYIPRLLPNDAPRDERYDRLVTCGEQGFSPDQIIRNWQDILGSGIAPADVLLLGVGGGTLSAVEYRLALALGARVAVVRMSGGAADALIADPWWDGVPNLLVMPFDETTLRAFVTPPKPAFSAEMLEHMAQAFHKRYVATSSGKLPANMRPWPKLAETFKLANIEQARYAVQILEACGFVVRPAADPDPPVVFASKQFSNEEIERMAEMEHGRWNVERLRDGWRPGKLRDDAKKIHDCIVPWTDLPEDVKHYDRDAVREFPAILAQAGMEIHRAR